MTTPSDDQRQQPTDDIVARKTDHLEVVLGGQVGFGRLTTGFEDIHLVHSALPELSLSEVNLSTSLFGRSMKAPFLISSMTGGPAQAATINRHLAEAAASLGIALAVGSQRVALEDAGDHGLAADLRGLAPSVPLVGNLGAAQILGPQGVDRVAKAIDMLQADGLFIHLNPLQEAVQDGGDTDWRGILGAIEALTRRGLPIAIKEVGFGLSPDNIKRLVNVGVTVVDIAGAGGTNWARVEGARGAAQNAAVAEAFTEWGNPTAWALGEARKIVSVHDTLIASGGIKNGVDAAKAIHLGADIVGQAAGSLPAAMESSEAVAAHFSVLIETLRMACFCTGSATLAALRRPGLRRE